MQRKNLYPGIFRKKSHKKINPNPKKIPSDQTKTPKMPKLSQINRRIPKICRNLEFTDLGLFGVKVPKARDLGPIPLPHLIRIYQTKNRIKKFNSELPSNQSLRVLIGQSNVKTA